jgi:heterotetrameric sarcosine oxidase gamma subunit
VTEFSVRAAPQLLALDLWSVTDARLGDIALPGPGRVLQAEGGAVLRVGPRRWWLDGEGFAAADVTSALGERGAVTPVGGGWNRVTLQGDWRDLVMQSGMFDAENRTFAAGSVAVTPLCHAPCVVRPIGDAQCDVLVAASYTAHCLGHWRHLGWQQGMTG